MEQIGAKQSRAATYHTFCFLPSPYSVFPDQTNLISAKPTGSSGKTASPKPFMVVSYSPPDTLTRTRIPRKTSPSWNGTKITETPPSGVGYTPRWRCFPLSIRVSEYPTCCQQEAVLLPQGLPAKFPWAWFPPFGYPRTCR